MNDTFIGNSDNLVNSGNKRNASKIYLALFLAVAVGGVIMAVHAYQYYGQPNVTAQPIGNVGQNDFQVADMGSSIPRTDEIVPVSERCMLGPIDTEAGYIEVTGMYYDDPLPLCITDDVVSDWFIEVEVMGGYHPWDGGIFVWQKAEFKGLVIAHWTLMNPDADCCTPKVWRAEFTVCGDGFCLDSNQYPDVSCPCWYVEDGQGTIPGKGVWFDAWSFWTGCEPGFDQDFTIISA